MSVNWVMLADGGGYTPLPGEQTLYQSPPRTTLSLQTSQQKYPSNSYSQQCKSGVVYLTTRRIIYLPVTPTSTLQSFAVPILNVSDSRVTAPWFGANKWEAMIQPVSGGGIPAQHTELDMVMEFKEGGAFDFASTFERLKERLKQAVDTARENGTLDNGDDSSRVNMPNVHLEDLPAYEESRQHTRVPDPLPSPPIDDRRSSSGVSGGGAAIIAPVPTSPQLSSTMSSPRGETFQPPDEPPPGYEETQRGSIVEELERQLQRESR